MAKKVYFHHLVCIKNFHKFSIESEEENNTKIGVDKMRCPRCGSEVQLDIGYSSTAPSFEAQAKLNIEASKMALHMAAEQKKIDEEMGLNEKVLVNPPPGERKSPFMLSKKVIEGIKEKVTPELEPLLD
jgi:hypothetical protein